METECVKNLVGAAFIAWCLFSPVFGIVFVRDHLDSDTLLRGYAAANVLALAAFFAGAYVLGA